MKKLIGTVFCLLLLCLSCFPAQAAAAEPFLAFVPKTLDISMEPDGSLSIPGGGEARICNGSETRAIQVTEISVTMAEGWIAQPWDSDFSVMPEDSRALGLRLRGDPPQADGTVSLTPENWVVEAGEFIDLALEVKIPRQTAACEKLAIASITFHLDWAEAKAPFTIDFEEREQGTIADMTPLQTDEAGAVPVLPLVAPEEGFAFTHWEDADGQPVAPGDLITSDITVHPMFESVTFYDIAFEERDHGTISDTTPLRTDKTGVVPQLPAVSTDKYYTFDHWEDAEGNPVQPGDVLTKDVVLHPVLEYDACIYKISFQQGSGGAISDLTPRYTDEDGRVASLPGVTPNADYQFIRWVDTNGNPVAVGTMLASDITLTPVFQAISYTNFTITASNRSQVGYKGTSGEVLNIPAKFQYSGKWYKTIAIGDDAFKGCTGLRQAVIPTTVTSIGARAFQNCTNLTSCNFPNSLNSLGYSAFQKSGLSGAVYLPDSLKSCGTYAFADCSKITSMSINGTMYLVTSTGVPCSICQNCTGLTKVEIRSGMKLIRSDAFLGCTALKYVILPSSLTKIEADAFGNNSSTGGCKSLTRIYFRGSSAQWNAIDINYSSSSYNYYFKNCAKTYNSNIALNSL